MPVLILPCPLDFPDGSAFIHYLVYVSLTCLIVLHRYQDPSVALSQLAFLHEMFDPVGQLEKANVVGDGTSLDPDPLRKLFMGIVELFHKTLVDARYFNGVKVLPLQVFDHGYLERLTVVSLSNDDGNFLQARKFCRSESTLSGDDFVGTLFSADQNGLKKAFFFYGTGEFEKALLSYANTGLGGVGQDFVDGHDSYAAPFFHILQDRR